MDKLALQLWLVRCELGGVSYCRRMDTDARFNRVAMKANLILYWVILLCYFIIDCKKFKDSDMNIFMGKIGKKQRGNA